jgi:GPI mannosyltransferase 1 subunit M
MVLGGRGRRRRAASPAPAAAVDQQQHEPPPPPPPPSPPRRQAASAALTSRAAAQVSAWTGLPADAARLLLLAAVVRLALVAWGEAQDRLSPDVKYTDTDYGVFTDAARSVWRGDGGVGGGGSVGWMRGTPFARATYRYSPLLAYAVLPNLMVGVFGKLLFSAADLVAGVQSYRLAEAAVGGGGGGSAAAVAAASAAGWWAAAAWLFNPFTATVSTRGSCDSLVVVMLLGLLQLLLALGPLPLQHRSSSSRGSSLRAAAIGLLADVRRDLPASFRAVAPAALLYGLAVHFRIYPIIYAPSTVLFLARRRARAEQQQQQQHEDEASGGSGRRPKPSPSPARRTNALSSSTSSSPSTAAALPFLRGLLTDGAAFGLTSAAAFFALGAAFYSLYGQLFLREAFLHHLGRLDPRHNFSIYFYPIYLQHFGGLDDEQVAGGAGAGGAAAAAGGVDPARWAGLPQVAALLSVAAGLHAHLPLAWLISTVAFVALNKVSTAQYFVWYFCLLPPVLPHLLKWRWWQRRRGRQGVSGASGNASLLEEEEVEVGEEDEALAMEEDGAGRRANGGSSSSGGKRRGGGGRVVGAANGASAAAAASPPVLAVLRPSVPRPLVLAAAAWAVLQLHWLAWGYAVEFAGRGAFLGLWAASVAFLAANAALAATIVREYGRGGGSAARGAGGAGGPPSFVALSLRPR